MTAQVPEILLYKEHRLNIRDGCEPLADYLKITGASPKFVISSTALWRGYMATWEIKNERLYLVCLDGEIYEQGPASIATIFPDYPDRVFAHWYSGTLSAPQGELLKSDGMFGFDDIYERDFHFEVERGVVVEIRVRKNSLSELGS